MQFFNLGVGLVGMRMGVSNAYVPSGNLAPLASSSLFKMTSVTGRIKLSSFVTKENLNYSVRKLFYCLLLLVSYTLTTFIFLSSPTRDNQ